MSDFDLDILANSGHDGWVDAVQLFARVKREPVWVLLLCPDFSIIELDLDLAKFGKFGLTILLEADWVANLSIVHRGDQNHLCRTFQLRQNRLQSSGSW